MSIFQYLNMNTIDLFRLTREDNIQGKGTHPSKS